MPSNFLFLCNPSSSQCQDEITLRLLDAPLIIVIILSFTGYNGLMSLVHRSLLLKYMIVSITFLVPSYSPIE